MRFRMAMGLVLLLLALASHAPAMAQSSSTNFKLSAVPGSSGLGTSTSYRLFSEIAGQPAGWSLGANNAVFSGFVRATGFLPLDTLSYSGTGGQFAMISLPIRRADYTPTGMLPQLGAYDDHVWRLGHYDTANDKYLEPGSGGLATVANGLGYWLITKNTFSNLRVIGLPQPAAGLVGIGHEFPLANGPAAAPGWNQMGNPFQYPLDVTHLVLTDFSTFAYVITSGSNTVTDQGVKTWDPATSHYVDATTLNGRQGFWVHKLATTDVYLVYLPGPSSSGTPSPELIAEKLGVPLSIVAGSSKASANRIASAQWSVSITGQQGVRVSEPVVMGAAAVPSGTWNTLSRGISPPPPGVELLTLRQTRTDWGRLSGDYLSVFQPQSDRMTWDFSVMGADAPGELTLQVASQDLPTGTRLWLTDRASGTRQELPSSGTVTVPTFSGQRDYRVEAIGATAQQPVANLGDGFVRAYPNPFRASAGLSFSLARGGDVSVDIFDLQGRRVRMIARRGLAAGEHVLVWDGKDDGGNVAGSGVYLARWHAAGENGTGRLVKID